MNQHANRAALFVAAATAFPCAALVLYHPSYLQLLFALLTVAIASLIARWSALDSTQRTQLVTEALQRIAQGNFEVRVRPRGNDEYEALMQAFNRTAEELSLTRERVEHLQKLSAWQDFAKRLAHEIKNPLTPIRLAVQEVAKKDPGTDPAFSRVLRTAQEIVEEEVETLRRMVSAFSEFARLPEVRTAPAELATFVRELGEERTFLEDAREEQRNSVHFEAGSTAIPVRIDRTMLRRALDNLVRNALEAGAQQVWVRCERRDEQAWIVIEDDGPGIPEEHRSRVFEPYFTTKTSQGGSGLGLAIVRKIALDHDGDVGLSERKGGGTRFELTLPLRPEGTRGGPTFVTHKGQKVGQRET